MGGRRIAVVGSGLAGLAAAHGLARGGHEVTVYSDRTPEQWLHDSTPTGIAARFGQALDFEASLGLDHWAKQAPAITGFHLSLSPKVGNRLATMAARTTAPAQAVDLRLQSHRWLVDLPKAGGRVVVEKVSPERLDAIAREHELTLVAVGRGPLQDLFARNEARSIYREPQRRLAFAIIKGIAPQYDGVPFTAAKFNLFADIGEVFLIPYWHRDHGVTSTVLFEAKPGLRFDRFGDVKSGDELLRIGKELFAELMPWDRAWFANAELADPRGWLVGGVTPAVREPVARLPSGALAMPLGDTAISMDPIAGQGANLGSKYAQHLVGAIAGHEGAFDDTWMRATFEAFWADHGAPTVKFTNALLEPMEAGGKYLLISQYGTTGVADSPRQRIANAIADNFADPRTITDAFLDKKLAKATVARVAGSTTLFMGGLARIGAKQLGRLFGKQPAHPLATAT
ncbi:MAG TPA: styrene monooxygenase/indole monooxygenase family protein [Kofleriaceae bacterium]|jgi:2-polyprenyl-6-methoxyphenol hydroxylase-like FAD-dependent oxidoreductase